MTPRYNLGVSSDHVRGELAVCCDLLVRTLALLNGTCKLELDKMFADLVSGYKEAFGGDPLAEPSVSRITKTFVGS